MITMENIITIIGIFSLGVVVGMAAGQLLTKLRRDYPPVWSKKP